MVDASSPSASATCADRAPDVGQDCEHPELRERHCAVEDVEAAQRHSGQYPGWQPGAPPPSLRPARPEAVPRSRVSPWTSMVRAIGSRRPGQSSCGQSAHRAAASSSPPSAELGAGIAGPQRPAHGTDGGCGALATAVRMVESHEPHPSPRYGPSAAAASRQVRCPCSTGPHGRRRRRLIGLRNYCYLQVWRPPGCTTSGTSMRPATTWLDNGPSSSARR